jgi:RNA polymerase sigma-70 factor (ECF subfamily)
MTVIAADELAKLWREQSALLTLLCRSRCATPEDCVQEAFVRLATQDPVPNDPVAWLVRVARNVAITYHRSDTRRQQREYFAAEQRPRWFASSHVRLSGDDPSLAVEKALEKLEESQREVVVAHLWGGMSFREIASAFDLSRSQAHRIYMAGLAALKEQLSPVLFEELTSEQG